MEIHQDLDEIYPNQYFTVFQTYLIQILTDFHDLGLV